MERTVGLRASSESGDTIDDPSEDALFLMLGDVEAGESSFLIVDRLADASGQTYAQALRNADGSYVVEYRDGSADRHYGTLVADVRSAHRLLTGWAFEVPGWRATARWDRVR
ncbi:hypothetical protein [Kribbella yunnanensis]|uniref:hypothetical protein n=1 Tax=Kribbella yunnanensis TaxID=190194 RepID=UPI0031D753E2